MLKGSREATPHGLQCWFCGILNPPDDHLLTHDAQTCLQGPPISFSSKRRHEMVNHLNKVHGVKDKSQGEAIAMKWKDTVEKQAWSCGFCAIAFTTFNDRLSHIATQHFERGQTIGEWDTTRVIKGLLQQPGMRRAWKDRLPSLLTWEVEDIIWENDAIAGLQHDLEVGPTDEKSAADLAEAAYVACRFNWGMESQRGMATAEARSNETPVANSLSPTQASLASAPDSGTNRFQALSAFQAFDMTFTTGPVTQTINTLNYGNGSTPVPYYNNSNNDGLAASSSYLQQTQSAITLPGNDDIRHGDPGNDIKGDRCWSRSAGSICETFLDTVFD